MKKLWYALQNSTEDDWGTGSFDYNEALEIAKKKGYKLIAVIDANYGEDGNPTTDGECIEEIKVEED